MNEPVSAREALLIEAIGEMVNLIDSVDRLTPELREASQEIDRAREGLRSSLAAFETQVLALTEKAKVVAVKHILTRTEEAARQSADLQRVVPWPTRRGLPLVPTSEPRCSACNRCTRDRDRAGNRG